MVLGMVESLYISAINKGIVQKLYYLKYHIVSPQAFWDKKKRKSRKLLQN
jgi:hypothetical protein